MKKIPTTAYPTEFMEEWNLILTESSLKLMTILIKQEESDLSHIQEQIKQTTESITLYNTTKDYIILNRKMQDNIQKLDCSIMDIKKKKIEGDLTDCRNQQVYSWKRAPFLHQYPLLHSKRPTKRKRGKS